MNSICSNGLLLMVVLSYYVHNKYSVVHSTLLSVSLLIYFCCPTITPHHLGTRPTLPELLKFNIPEEIGTKYLQFGVFLMNDITGHEVEMIAHKNLNDAERITIEILQKWLTGRRKVPVTWTTLVEVLHDSGLSALAVEIEAVKCSASELINCTGHIL